MSEGKKFSDEELKSLKELQQNYLNVQNRFGQLHLTRIGLEEQLEQMNQIEVDLKKEFSDIQSKEKELVDELTKKYGEGSLDPKSGVFTPTNS